MHNYNIFHHNPSHTYTVQIYIYIYTCDMCVCAYNMLKPPKKTYHIHMFTGIDNVVGLFCINNLTIYMCVSCIYIYIYIYNLSKNKILDTLL